MELSEKNAAATKTVAASSVYGDGQGSDDYGIDDGKYTPDNFGWSGGSGRLKYIKCQEITV
ncbi:MAG: hypothetical protein IJV66_02295, partial [Firmicutes bacterium]|nr:hypothetical protein [Bacillota bacterium]